MSEVPDIYSMNVNHAANAGRLMDHEMRKTMLLWERIEVERVNMEYEYLF